VNGDNGGIQDLQKYGICGGGCVTPQKMSTKENSAAKSVDAGTGVSDAVYEYHALSGLTAHL
jgi:hypothetical protein